MADQGTSNGGRGGGGRPPYGRGRREGTRGTPYGGDNRTSGLAWPPAPGAPLRPVLPHHAPMAPPPQAAYAREELAYRATWPAPSEVGDAPPPASSLSLIPGPRHLALGASSSTDLAPNAGEEALVVSALALVSAAAVHTALALLSVAAGAAAAAAEVGWEDGVSGAAVGWADGASGAAIGWKDGASAAALALATPQEAAAGRGELTDAPPPSAFPVWALDASSTMQSSSKTLAKDVATKLFVGKSVADDLDIDDVDNRSENDDLTKYSFGLHHLAGTSSARRARECLSYSYDVQGEFQQSRGGKGSLQRRPALGLGIVSGAGLTASMEDTIRELRDLYQAAYTFERDIATATPQTLSLTWGTTQGVAPSPAPSTETTFEFVEELLQEAEELREQLVSLAPEGSLEILTYEEYRVRTRRAE
ncbi:unnamed protein product [Urochloa humidicola]